jgi:hypothetical protein
VPVIARPRVLFPDPDSRDNTEDFSLFQRQIDAAKCGEDGLTGDGEVDVEITDAQQGRVIICHSYSSTDRAGAG